MTPERTSTLLPLLQAAPYNIRFIDDDKLPLYDKALTTAGYAKQHDTKSNERLAFLSDRVLSLVVAEYMLQ